MKFVNLTLLYFVLRTKGAFRHNATINDKLVMCLPSFPASQSHLESSDP